MGVISMTETSMADKPTQVSKTDIPVYEKQQLVAGIFASKEAADSAMEKIKDLRLQLQKVNASNILVLTKNDKGKVDINIIDIISTSNVNIPRWLRVLQRTLQPLLASQWAAQLS